MKMLKFLTVLLILWVALVALPKQALADPYDESQSNPLRIVAYFLHPIGVAAEWTVIRPIHTMVSGHKSLELFHGHLPHPPLFEPMEPVDIGVSKIYPMVRLSHRRKKPVREPIVERVIIKQVTVEKPVVVEKTYFKIKEIPKVVEKIVEKVVEVERIIFPNVAFRFDSAELTELGKGSVYLAAEKLKENKNVVIGIEGHADDIGDEEYNMKLGLRRAEAVREEILKLGVSPDRISVASRGESSPLIEEQTDWARALNRRVELKISTQ